MKVVIAGGCGLIGRAICASLVAAGDEVVVLSRNPDGPAAPGVRPVVWQPPAPGPWAAEIAGTGAVINLAGASIGRWPWTVGRRRLLLESRLGATRAIVGAISALPVGQRPAVLLSASGTDAYEGRDLAPATEETPPGASFLARLCLAWEAEATRAHDFGVRVVLMRTSSVLAPGAPFLRVVSLPVRLGLGGRLGSGRQWVSWVGIEDVVGLYRWAMVTDGVCGTLNVAAPDPRPQASFVTALAGSLHRPSRVATPAWAIRLALGGQATLALGSRRVWPAKALELGYVFRQPRLEGALAASLLSVLGR
jgi:uncharacterized protein